MLLSAKEDKKENQLTLLSSTHNEHQVYQTVISYYSVLWDDIIKKGQNKGFVRKKINDHKKQNKKRQTKGFFLFTKKKVTWQATLTLGRKGDQPWMMEKAIRIEY